MFWILGRVFGFWEVFRILGRVLSLRDTVRYYTNVGRIQCIIETNASWILLLLTINIFKDDGNLLTNVTFPYKTLILACENIRFSSLFPAGDVSRGGNETKRPQRRRARRNRCILVRFMSESQQGPEICDVISARLSRFR